jgi:hypothetical protein
MSSWIFKLLAMRIVTIGARGHHQYVFDELAKLPDVGIAGVSSGCEDDVDPLVVKCKAAGIVPTLCHGVFYDFVRHVKGVSRSFVTSHDTFVLTRACLLARESADTGQPINF